MSTKNTGAPDYMGLAQFMGQTGYDLGQSQTFANRPNINTPFGSIDWQYQPGTYTGPGLPDGSMGGTGGTGTGGLGGMTGTGGVGGALGGATGAVGDVFFGSGGTDAGSVWQNLTQGSGTTSQAPIPGATGDTSSALTSGLSADGSGGMLSASGFGTKDNATLSEGVPPPIISPDIAGNYTGVTETGAPPAPMTNAESGLVSLPPNETSGGMVNGVPTGPQRPGSQGTGTGGEPSTFGQWTQNVTLSPEQQAILESQQSLQQGTLGSALGMLGGGLSGQSAEEALYGKLTSRLDPRFEQQQNQLRTRLYNMGLREGDAAFDQQMQQFGQGRDDAYQQAAYQATLGGEQSLQNQINAINALAGRPVSQPSFPGFMGASGSQVPDYLGAALQGFNTNQLQQSQNLGGLASILGLFI